MKNIEKLFLSKYAKGRCWSGYEPVPGKKPYSDDSCRPARSKKKKKVKKEEKEKKEATTKNEDEAIKKEIPKKQRRVAKLEQPISEPPEPPKIPTNKPKQPTGKEYLRNMLTEAASERLGIAPDSLKRVGNTLYNQRLDLPVGGGLLSAGMMDDFGPGGLGLRWSKDF